MIDIQSAVNSIETALTGLAETVGVWMNTNYEEGDYPLINIRDTEDELKEEMVGSELRTLVIEIDLVCSNGVNTMKDVRTKRKEIAIAVKNIGFDECTYVGSKSGTLNEGKKLGGATLRFEVVYETNEFI